MTLRLEDARPETSNEFQTLAPHFGDRQPMTAPLISAAARAAVARAVGAGGFLNAAVAVMGPDGAVETCLAGDMAPGGPPLTRTDLRLRVASVSKAVTGRVAATLAAQGTLDLDQPVAALLDLPEAWRDITLRDLLGHVSGLRDRGGYLPDAGETVEAFAARVMPQAQGPQARGWFTYANLNYLIAAAALERHTGQRFDQLARLLVLEPAGVQGGFNWAGVTPAARRHRLPIWQRRTEGLVQQTEPEDADWDSDLIWAEGRGFALAAYRPGEDTALVSPHAGLRLSLEEGVQLARELARPVDGGAQPRDPVWQFNGSNGQDCDGLYQAYGLGLMLYRDHPQLPCPLIGHAGHALGFTGGLWHNPNRNLSAAIYLTGSADLTDGQEDECFYAGPELQLMQSIFA